MLLLMMTICHHDCWGASVFLRNYARIVLIYLAKLLIFYSRLLYLSSLYFHLLIVIVLNFPDYFLKWNDKVIIWVFLFQILQICLFLILVALLCHHANDDLHYENSFLHQLLLFFTCLLFVLNSAFLQNFRLCRILFTSFLLV